MTDKIQNPQTKNTMNILLILFFFLFITLMVVKNTVKEVHFKQREFSFLIAYFDKWTKKKKMIMMMIIIIIIIILGSGTSDSKQPATYGNRQKLFVSKRPKYYELLIIIPLQKPYSRSVFVVVFFLSPWKSCILRMRLQEGNWATEGKFHLTNCRQTVDGELQEIIGQRRDALTTCHVQRPSPMDWWVIGLMGWRTDGWMVDRVII